MSIYQLGNKCTTERVTGPQRLINARRHHRAVELPAVRSKDVCAVLAVLDTYKGGAVIQISFCGEADSSISNSSRVEMMISAYLAA